MLCMKINNFYQNFPTQTKLKQFYLTFIAKRKKIYNKKYKL